MTFRFHVLAVPHTITTPEYSSCAFTMKVLKLCKMLKMLGHTVIHYGHQDSMVECDEHVTVVSRYDLDKSYKDHDWRKLGWPKYNEKEDWAYKVFYKNTIKALTVHKQPGDFLLCPFGWMHKPVADAHPDMIAIEPGIGYPTGGFARFRVFESYSIMSAYHGQQAIGWAKNDFWYDTVIPNYFDPDEFTFSAEKDDYFAFVGRVNAGKGVHIAEQIAEATDTQLIVAGAGDFEFKSNRVVRIGVVNPARRAMLLSRARATLCPSTFMEPFCGTQVESFLSGTPVISSDWGAFAEYNKHGLTGYRCKTFEQFTWAARNVDSISPHVCRVQGKRFSLDKIAPLYDSYFQSVSDVFSGKGWYHERLDRDSLAHTVF